MNKILKQLLLQQKFDTANVVALIEMLDENGNYSAECIADILINGCPKYNLNINKIRTTVYEHYAKYYKDIEITEFTETKINILEDRIRVYFNRNDTTYEDYHDLHDINKYCDD